MSLRRRFLARLAAAVVALTIGAGTFGATSSLPDASEEAGATWSFRIEHDDKDDDGKGGGWHRTSRGATWS
ncbi:MAG: twin-arginine translocation signal domain-containing protein [Actinomycetota bacterium]